jgi:predicted ATP-grasp superfamily ATP-dependent carboligase
VVADDFHAALALVRGLRSGGYRSVSAAAPPRTYVSYSRAVAAVADVPGPEQAPDDFTAHVARAARDFGAEAILPGTEASLLSLAPRRQSLPAPLAAPSTGVVRLATDKARVVALAATCELPGPASTIGTPHELAAQAQAFSYPLVLKPHRTRLELSGNRLAYYTARRMPSAAELREELVALPASDWVVQPYLEGTLCAVGGVAWQGRLIAAVHQVSRRIWPRDTGYSCFAETVPRDLELESRIAKLVSEVGWSGIFQAQMIRSPDGRLWFIDFNPRAYGSLALAVRAGANLPALWAGLVLGGAPAPVGYRAGVRYRLEHNDVRAIASLLRDRQLRAGLSALRPRPRTAHAVFSLRDPGPLVVSARKMAKRARR